MLTDCAGRSSDTNGRTKAGSLKKSEVAKLYNLLLGELSDKEREKLRLNQKEWDTKVNTESKEKKLENIEKKAIEMAKRYDKIRKK